MVFVFVKKVRLVKYFSWGGFPRAKSAWQYGKPPRPGDQPNLGGKVFLFVAA